MVVRRPTDTTCVGPRFVTRGYPSCVGNRFTLVVPVKQTVPYRNSSANRSDTLLLLRSRSSSFLTGISDLMVSAFLI